MLLLILLALHFQREPESAEQLAFRAKRVDLATRMQLGLSSASEAEKSAVMAVTDKDSKLFADQAQAAASEVERERRTLEALLRSGGTESERDLLTRFSQAFAEFQRIDKDLLDLAVKNTNLKAYSLAFGSAAINVDEMTVALDRLAAANAGSPKAAGILLLASGAQTAALRIQTLFAPHIAEENDEAMDKLEASMAKEDSKVRNAFRELKAIPEVSGSADLQTASSRYAAFDKVKGQILALSRENTNVRSLTISLNQKRKATMLCRDSLSELKQAILDEPAGGTAYGPRPRPR